MCSVPTEVNREKFGKEYTIPWGMYSTISNLEVYWSGNSCTL